MNSHLRILATVFALIITVSSLAGCSPEPGERTQLVGQECFVDNDCVQGAICVQRSCRYETSARVSDAGDEDTGRDIDHGDILDVTFGEDTPIMDVAVGEDVAEPICSPTAARCISNTQVETCRNDGTGFNTQTCEDGLRCTDGECVRVDQSVCQFQNQMCSDGGLGDDYLCSDLFGVGQRRCFGTCDPWANDADSTCPDAGTKCLPVDDQDDFGLCLSKCTLDEGCNIPGYVCGPGIGNDSEGLCLPPE